MHMKNAKRKEMRHRHSQRSTAPETPSLLSSLDGFTWFTDAAKYRQYSYDRTTHTSRFTSPRFYCSTPVAEAYMAALRTRAQ